MLAAGTEDTAYTVSAADLLAGFADVDGDTLAVANLATSNGTVADNGDGTFTVTPSLNFNGPVTLTYDVLDGNGGSIVGATRSYTVAAVNDNPVITSNGGGVVASISIAENTTALTTVTSTDVEGSTPHYSIFGGDDAAAFMIDANTGVLAFLAAPDFENPTDVGADNIYDVILRVSDGAGGLDTQSISVTVTNVAGSTQIGDDAANVLIGTGEEDLLSGRGGRDMLSGGAAGDTINGGDGDDSLYGNAGADTINGGAGIDYIDGGADGDTIHGGDDNDTIFGQDGQRFRLRRWRQRVRLRRHRQRHHAGRHRHRLPGWRRQRHRQHVDHRHRHDVAAATTTIP